MLVIGVTGGIGSGKSAVTDRFAEHGVTVVDADLAARVIVQPGKPALQSIAEHYGEGLILDNGELDRAALRTIIFADPEERHWLEALTHPLINEEIQAQIAAASSSYTILASPLLIETMQHQLVDRILVVDVPVELQIQRTVARDQNSEQQVRAIINSQASREERLAKADDVIVNDRGLSWLDQEVKRLHAFYLSLLD